ncbi:TIGR03986 family type III CRISPR-associated RAMP protein [Dethiosulfovibrio salsuginis]|uniref:CRISPR-associated protein n=1 Tax=Dethiosulfovibrio salsuginis TaxID=561720 RepID=A0A1X7KUZ3_9BACT|nr:TIGR03986 family CRISPR-associated RAMP protein [Dethiosulfovibrio salsuginis]SMG45134.1 CRISPR-associated protein [Dethiosulfovibrio salsuginis]
MVAIPSPYSFVPLSKNVFFPDWADRVSLDVPFSDGISGFIQVSVTAKTPIYIRGNQDDKTKPGYSDFFRVCPKGPYAIPGTSFKGMIRSVMEIASFSKIAGTNGDTARVDDKRYAIRDLQNRDLYTGKITEQVGRAYKPKVKTAWLSQDREDGRWVLNFCQMARVEQEDLERAFPRARGIGTRRQSAKDKYGLIPPETEVQFDCGPEKDHPHSRGNMLRYRKASNLGKGKDRGIIVLTGQPAPRDGRPGKKHMEFIFFDTKSQFDPVPDNIRKDFTFAHNELGENRKPNQEWAFWESRFKEGKKVPVFVLMEGREISSMGLALMYRLPYSNSIHQAIRHTSPDHLNPSRLDLAELVFGRVEGTDGLRGRVSVENLLAHGDPKTKKEVATVLGAPKPTYYPNYIKQDAGSDGTVKKRYQSFMDSNCEIRGWKRYIVREDKEDIKDVPPSPTQNVETRFSPLPSETTFSGRIYVHNLRPQELGALIWALTWGGNPKLRHSLGMAKPLGFGSVSVSIDGQDLAWCDPNRSEDLSAKNCTQAFESMMDSFIGDKGKWKASAELRSLLAMADPAHKWDFDLTYPRLGGARDNQFVDFKKDNASLLGPLDGKVEEPKSAKRKPPKIAPKEAEPDTPEGRFLKDIDGWSLKDIQKNHKKSGISPDKIDQTVRKQIYDKLAKKCKNAPQLSAVLKEWKP